MNLYLSVCASRAVLSSTLPLCFFRYSSSASAASSLFLAAASWSGVRPPSSHLMMKTGFFIRKICYNKDLRPQPISHLASPVSNPASSSPSPPYLSSANLRNAVWETKRETIFIFFVFGLTLSQRTACPSGYRQSARRSYLSAAESQRAKRPVGKRNRCFSSQKSHFDIFFAYQAAASAPPVSPPVSRRCRCRPSEMFFW